MKSIFEFLAFCGLGAPGAPHKSKLDFVLNIKSEQNSVFVSFFIDQEKYETHSKFLQWRKSNLFTGKKGILSQV